MGSSTGLENLERRIEEQFGLKRGIVLAVGVACLALGVLSIALPISLYGALIRLVGVLLFGSGAVKAVQLLIGRRSAAERPRSWPVIVCQVALDLIMGALLLNHWRASVSVVTSAVRAAVPVRGRADDLHGAALAAPRSRVMLALNGLVAGAIGVVIVSRLVDDPIRWAGVFVGLKLLTFGGTLTWIAWRALKSDSALVYELEMPAPRSASSTQSTSVPHSTSASISGRAKSSTT